MTLSRYSDYLITKSPVIIQEGFAVNDPDIWVSNHWSPYWYSCGLCLPELRPDFILHMDKLETDSAKLLEELGMAHLNVSYPHTMKGHSGHSSRHNYNYFSQLSKKQASIQGAVSGSQVFIRIFQV